MVKERILEIWKYAATALASIVITMIVGYFSGFTTFITEAEAEKIVTNKALSRDEIKRVIRETAPWNSDKGSVLSGINNNHDEIEKLRRDVKDLVKAQSDLTAEIRLLIRRQENR